MAYSHTCGLVYMPLCTERWSRRHHNNRISASCTLTLLFYDGNNAATLMCVCICVCGGFNMAAQKLTRANTEQCPEVQNNYPTLLLVKAGKTQDGAVGKDQ